jgi:sigma-B regulation protein RsbU (phosphoserine phosphatase)
MSAIQPPSPLTRRSPWKTVGKEIQCAADVQRALLPPSFHADTRFEIAAAVRPCGVMSGDFFDYFDANGDLRIVVGDVCGKGVPAALHAAVVQGMLTTEEADAAGGPARMVRHLNRLLCRRRVPDSYVTLVYAVITADHRLTYCNAGHCHPLLVSGESVRELTVGGPPVGLFVDAQYEEASMTVSPGDLLLVVSDGITEAPRQSRRRREDFGDTRLLELVRAQNHATATEVLNRVLDDVSAFTNRPPEDDMTAVVVRCRT